MKFELHTMSMLQKIIIALCASLIIFSVFAHNPLGGYFISKSTPISVNVEGRRPCTQSEKKEYRRSFEVVRQANIRDYGEATPTDDKIDAEVRQCTKRNQITVYEKKPLLEWSSKNPLILWFGNVVNLFQIVVVIALIGIVVVFVFKGERGK